MPLDSTPFYAMSFVGTLKMTGDLGSLSLSFGLCLYLSECVQHLLLNTTIASDSPTHIFLPVANGCGCRFLSWDQSPLRHSRNSCAGPLAPRFQAVSRRQSAGRAFRMVQTRPELARFSAMALERRSVSMSSVCCHQFEPGHCCRFRSGRCSEGPTIRLMDHRVIAHSTSLSQRQSSSIFPYPGRTGVPVPSVLHLHREECTSAGSLR